MKHLLPRKIKKAYKSTRSWKPYKTKWMRYVHTQLQGFMWVNITHDGKCDYGYNTKYGEVLIRYHDKKRMLNNNILQ